MKKHNTKLLLALCAPMIAFTAIAVAPNQKRSNDASLSRNLNTFSAIVKNIELNYVDTINNDQSFNAAIKAFLSNTDPYTEYYSQEEQEKLQKLTTGEYAGIGSYIMERNGKSYISEPIEGSPAARAGLKPGDHIIRVDSIDTSSMPSDQVTKYLKGVPSTFVTVTVDRPYVGDSILTFKILRGKIKEPTVPYYTIIGNTGYIRISSFVDTTPDEVNTILEEFKNNPNVKSLIIDLRSNGGGIVDAGIDLVSNFLPKGTEIVKLIGRESNNNRTYKTRRTPIMPNIPLAILIDGGTASTSEIIAGSLQDLDRAVLIGSRSYGKGLVQTPLPLPYNAMMKVTTAKYYLPSGRLIQAIDYSHKNPDGSVARVPDSLTNVFHTANGREVRDGGGLRPDTTINWGEFNRLVYNIVMDHWAFDYANKFAATHDSIAPADKFVITDEIFADFKKSINPKKFKYDKVCEDLVDKLRKTAELEGYMNDETKEKLDTLAKLLTHNLDHDLNTHRQDIEEYLGAEIVGRYYYEKGKTAYQLRNDEAIKTAINIFSDSKKYNSIIKPSSTTTKQSKR